MNIFDSSDIQKQINEEQNKWLEEEKPKEKLEDVEEQEVEEIETEEQEESENEIGESEEEKRPKDGKGWKEVRERTKAIKAEAEAHKKEAQDRAKEAQELRERLARLEGREEARAKPEVKEVDPEPDRDIDPDDHIRWENRQIKKQMAEIQKQALEANAIAKVESTRRGLKMVEDEYVKANKMDDYQAAIDHVKTVEKNLIKLQHPSATDSQIESHLEAQRLKIAEQVYAKGTNPAEHFYKMAETLGYQKDKKEKINDKPNISALNKNMEKNASLIGSSSADKTGGIPADKLVKMSIADLLNVENSKKLNDEIKRQEAKWMNGA